ncbi:uncharacterized protein LOC129262311 [Lytechinus pictus]|uniref:uncharacterized protein LOC129262311 n=1 Tax=Lytechinus pictus TaxID=7653 RepID=UPI0030B9B81D
MIDSEEQIVPLSHHMTWIHNFPKCDSCVTMNAAEKGRHSHEHRPFPQESAHHNAVAMVNGESSRGLLQGAKFLPGIVQGRSIEREQRLGTSRTTVDNMPVPNPNMSNYLPQISTRHRIADNTSPTTRFKVGITRAQQRLAKSLDSEEQSKIRVQRRMSLPSISSEKMTSGSSGTSASDSGVYDVTNEEDEDTLLSRVSLEESASEDEQDNSNLTIDPFPYQSERSPYESEIDTAPPKPATPIKPKKKKKKEKLAPPPPPKPRPKKAKKPFKRKRPINFVALRRHEQEVARRHPIKKQFLYSNVLESELKSYIPPRLPGGKLKSVYKRTQTGDIMFPHDPITVHYTELKNESEQDTQSPWQRRRQEALQAFLERRKKLLKRVSSNDKKRRVRFTLPPGHIDSASESDDDVDKSNDTSHESGADNDERSQGDSQINDEDGSQPPRISLVVEEALRALESKPSRKDSDDLVQNWLQTTEDKNSVERTPLGTKLPKISENVVLSISPPLVHDDPHRRLHGASKISVNVTEFIDTNGL